MNAFEVRRSGATAAAGGDTATSRPLSSHQDAPHQLCICDPELRLLQVFDLRCPTHGLSVTLLAAARERKEADRG
jgi:hypothetical protein